MYTRTHSVKAYSVSHTCTAAQSSYASVITNTHTHTQTNTHTHTQTNTHTHTQTNKQENTRTHTLSLLLPITYARTQSVKVYSVSYTPAQHYEARASR